MRNFQSRKSWGSRDRVSLLAHPSPPPSPRHGVTDSSFERAFPPEKEMLPSENAIQFVPAYEEAISPATTQPPTPSEDSMEGIRYPVTPSPAKSSKRSKSRDDASAVSSSNSSTRKGTRIGRLASLFSSRAIVKTMAPEVGPVSPPRSESSSGYVGWPGTQDKRGGTVAIESSYEDSDQEHGKQQWVESSFESMDEGNSAADFHLAAAVADATAAANSPMANKQQTEAEKVHEMATPMHSQVRSLQEIYGNDQSAVVSPSAMTDPWGLSHAQDETSSDLSTSYSKTSSAYFNTKDVRVMKSRVGHNRNAAAAVMRFQPGEPQPPTEETMALKDHFAPPHRAYNATNALGFRGLLDKTRDVPNLMDGSESDSTASRGTSTHSSISGAYRNTRSRQRRPREDLEDQILEEVSSDIFDGVSQLRGDGESDVFDGLSNAGSKGGYLRRTPSIPEDEQYTLNGQHTLGATPRVTNENLNLVMLGGGLTTIQTTANDFTNRQTASDFDENLTNSDYDQYGFAKIPGFNEMASAGMSSHDRSLGTLFTQPSPRAQQAIVRYKNKAEYSGASEASSSLLSDPYPEEDWGRDVDGGLQQYYVHPNEMKLLVKKFRKMSTQRSPNLSYDDLEREEDATKVFALSEMRSRIMESDIERGLERRGGTTVVDDIVLTPYNRAAMRVRDACIVAKAWRDGATPQDVMNTSLMTRRAERAYFIVRPTNRRHNRLDNTRSPEYFSPSRYTWEEVLWVDDLEISQYTCQSLGPRHSRGFEMFTIGDCQSILLKLCNERCLVSIAIWIPLK
jgi:hypothetical protein